MVSRRFIPPDNASTFASAQSVSDTNASNSSARARHSARLSPKNRPYTTRFSRTRSSESTVSSCGQTPIRARICDPWVTGSRPNTCNSPPDGGDTDPIMRIVDDFPAPFGPRKPKASPRRTSTSIPRTASKSPKRFTNPRARIRGSCISAGASDIRSGRGPRRLTATSR